MRGGTGDKRTIPHPSQKQHSVDSHGANTGPRAAPMEGLYAKAQSVERVCFFPEGGAKPQLTTGSWVRVVGRGQHGDDAHNDRRTRLPRCEVGRLVTTTVGAG